jgi:hypothetical protein
VNADINNGYEEYLALFDHFYDENVEVARNYVTKQRKGKLMTFDKSLILKWCGREDLNLHEIAPASTSS